MGSHPMGATNRGGVGSNDDFQTAIFDQYLATFQKRCKIGTLLL